MSKTVVNLFRTIRENLKGQKLFMPGLRRKSANWPICMTCGREPHAVNLEEVSKWRVGIRAKCTHKAYPEPSDPDFESVVYFDIPVGTDRDEHIRWALTAGRFFDPGQA